MNDLCLYRIEIDRLVDPDELRASSPLDLRVEPRAGNTTLLMAHTDQSGMIGLLRHLHGRGFVLLSMEREPDPTRVRN